MSLPVETPKRRGRCGWCGKSVALRANGTMRQHSKPRSHLPCDGSHYFPAESVRMSKDDAWKKREKQRALARQLRELGEE